MKTAILYASSHGTTEKVARKIAQMLDNENTVIINLKRSPKIDVSDFETIILGGSIHAGAIQGAIKSFYKKNMVTLLQKRLGLFICAMNTKDYDVEFENAYPELLRNQAVSKQVVGGEFLVEKMNFFERFVVKKITGVKESVSKIDDAAVSQFVKELKEE